MSVYQATQRAEGDQTIPGAVLPVYIKNGPHHLTQLKVYQDGMVDCWKLVSIERFMQRIEDGWVVTTLPEGAEVCVHPLGSFHAIGVKNRVAEAELVKEVMDVVDELNGRPTSMSRCYDAFREYESHPSEDARERLRLAYEAMPAHNRRFVLGDMDRKDWPIRAIIYGSTSDPVAPLPEATTTPQPAQPRTKVPGDLAMAINLLYRGNGMELAPLFGREVLTEVEEIFRTGRHDDGIARMMHDINDALATHPNRPMITVRLSGALSSLAEHLVRMGRTDEGLAAHLRAIALNPDSPMPALHVAKLAVERQDRALAAELMKLLARFGIQHLGDARIGRALGVDIDGFDRLL